MFQKFHKQFTSHNGEGSTGTRDEGEGSSDGF